VLRIPLPADAVVPSPGHAGVGHAPFEDAIAWLFVGIYSSVQPEPWDFASVLWLHLDFPLAETMTDF